MNGKGYLHINLYRGKLSAAGDRQGFGVQLFPNGCVYVGQWENNQANGTGKLILPDNTSIEGEFRNNIIQKGSIEFFNGSKFEGQFEGDTNERFLKGRFEFASGVRLEAEWENGIIQNGRLIDHEDTTISTFDGETIVYSNGRKSIIVPKSEKWIYEGEILSDRANGSGVFYSTFLQYYTGIFENEKIKGLTRRMRIQWGEISEGTCLRNKKVGKWTRMLTRGYEITGDVNENNVVVRFPFMNDDSFVGRADINWKSDEKPYKFCFLSGVYYFSSAESRIHEIKIKESLASIYEIDEVKKRGLNFESVYSRILGRHPTILKIASDFVEQCLRTHALSIANLHPSLQKRFSFFAMDTDDSALYFKRDEAQHVNPTGQFRAHKIDFETDDSINSKQNPRKENSEDRVFKSTDRHSPSPFTTKIPSNSSDKMHIRGSDALYLCNKPDDEKNPFNQSNSRGNPVNVMNFKKQLKPQTMLAQKDNLVNFDSRSVNSNSFTGHQNRPNSTNLTCGHFESQKNGRPNESDSDINKSLFDTNKYSNSIYEMKEILQYNKKSDFAAKSNFNSNSSHRDYSASPEKQSTHEIDNSVNDSSFKLNRMQRATSALPIKQKSKMMDGVDTHTREKMPPMKRAKTITKKDKPYSNLSNFDSNHKKYSSNSKNLFNNCEENFGSENSHSQNSRKNISHKATGRKTNVRLSSPDLETIEFFRGKMVNRMLQGECEIMLSSGVYKKGYFHRHQMEGQGMVQHPNGLAYIGTFKNNLLDGPAMIRIDSLEVNCLFSKDEFKDSKVQVLKNGVILVADSEMSDPGNFDGKVTVIFKNNYLLRCKLWNNKLIQFQNCKLTDRFGNSWMGEISKEGIEQRSVFHTVDPPGLSFYIPVEGDGMVSKL